MYKVYLSDRTLPNLTNYQYIPGSGGNLEYLFTVEFDKDYENFVLRNKEKDEKNNLNTFTVSITANRECSLFIVSLSTRMLSDNLEEYIRMSVLKVFLTKLINQI